MNAMDMPLPEPAHRGPTGTGSYFNSFTADQMHAYALAYAAAEAARERERCAKVCEAYGTSCTTIALAAAIRAGSAKS